MPSSIHKRDIGRDLYIIQMHTLGNVKVGRSSNVSNRLKQLQTGCPHKLKVILHVVGQGSLEKVLHDRMSRYRLEGEWFTEEGLAELPSEMYELLDLEKANWWVPEK